MRIIWFYFNNLTHLLQFLSMGMLYIPSKYALLNLWSNINLNSNFIHFYFLSNECLWLDGFLFDFLQNNTVDIWLRSFVIYTCFLFSERLIFDCVVSLYIDYFVWYTHNFSILEASNVFEMLNYIISTATALFLFILLFSLI